MTKTNTHVHPLLEESLELDMPTTTGDEIIFDVPELAGGERRQGRGHHRSPLDGCRRACPVLLLSSLLTRVTRPCLLAQTLPVTFISIPVNDDATRDTLLCIRKFPLAKLNCCVPGSNVHLRRKILLASNKSFTEWPASQNYLQCI